MIELKSRELIFRFPDVHKDAVCRINFQRTLRIPDDNRSYPLPPGFGSFPIENASKHTKRLPAELIEKGGALLPMYQSEALWLNFSGDYPCAIKIAAGKINAVTGSSWDNGLSKEKQDYIVVPDQPWLDGFCVQKGLIRQFVAMPLGEGYTAEEQLTGIAQHGGLQIIVYPMKRKYYEKLQARKSEYFDYSLSMCKKVCSKSMSFMGLAPGGLMRQEIYQDDYGYDAWHKKASSRCFVHILNSLEWEKATAKPLPCKPPTAKDYSSAGMPWFEYYDEQATALAGSKILSGLDSVAAAMIKNGDGELTDNGPIGEPPTIKLGKMPEYIQDGDW